MIVKLLKIKLTSTALLVTLPCVFLSAHLCYWKLQDKTERLLNLIYTIV